MIKEDEVGAIVCYIYVYTSLACINMDDWTKGKEKEF